MPNTKFYSKSSGFSIIEVVVTLFILGVTLILFQTTSNTVVLNRYSRYKEIALRAADQKVQTIRTTPFDNIPASGSFSDPLITGLPGGTGTLAVQDENARLKRIIVTVSWKSSQLERQQSIQLETFVAMGGLGQ